MTETPPLWLTIAVGEFRRGVREIPGPDAHPRIALYHSVTSLKATSDEIPWCSSFACWCVEEAGPRSPRSAAAKDWLTWGAPSLPRLGALAVFTRKGGHHVAFYIAQLNDTVLVLGGNQSNAITFALQPGAALLDLRWTA